MKPAINKPIERPKLKECLLKYLIIQWILCVSLLIHIKYLKKLILFSLKLK